ncbi:hypothetical protein PTKIN_Ptkin16aG0497000 [Pterospermum kingtungense]
MEEVLRAAQSGNIDALYGIIKNDGNVFSHIDQMEFVETPLHIAAAAGHTDFAMEIMNLKPSFARKLNQRGFSPIHLALENGQTKMVVNLLSVDKDLVPLHIAARNNNLRAFRAILMCIQKTPEDNLFQRGRILNLQDNDGNTVLHIAAANNQSEMIQLFVKCKAVDKKITNERGFTALDVLQRQTLVDSRESVKILNRAPSWFTNLSETSLEDYAKKMRMETINALLVVLSLVLTVTYQAILNPPDRLSQSNRYGFFMFYVPNGVAFFMAFIMTMTLFEASVKSIKPFLYPLYLVMCFSYGVAMGFLAPSTASGWGAYVATWVLVYFIFYVGERKI